MERDDDSEIKPHEFCSVDCPCGHWREHYRRATRRADGRRGRVTLDTQEGNNDGSR